MNLAISFLPVLALFMLTACGPTLQSSEIKSDKNSLNNKAIVVTRIHAPYTNFFGSKTDNRVNSIWEQFDPTKTAEKKLITTFLEQDYSLSTTHLQCMSI